MILAIVAAPLFGVAVPLANSVRGDEDLSAIDFFETRIRPVLVTHCYECHSDAAPRVGGGLWLDSADAMRTGGDSGPAIVPGQVDAGMLISALRYESSEMPPSGPLPEHVIRDFQHWIEQGAVDPRTASAGGTTPAAMTSRSTTQQAVPADAAPGDTLPSSIDLTEGRTFWAFQPPRPVPIPVSTLASRNWIDAFLNHAMENADVRPLPPADADAQLRRLAFDLTGLPPSADLVASWRMNPGDATWRQIVDRLIASPEFAEHWARHWMDVARYADSNGSDFNATFHDAWRYRDYLIRHIAEDTPIDEMIRAQIAGDLMPSRDDVQRRDQTIATTFLMVGTKMLSERDKPKLTMDVVDEQIDTIGRAFMGLTLGCARCHDHKFDPIAMQDYYALAGIFRSTLCLQGESQKYVSTWTPVELPATPAHRDAVAAHQREVKRLQVAIASSKDQPEAMAKLQAELTRLQDHAPPPLPTAMGVVDQPTDQIGDCEIHIRGETSKLGRKVPRGFLRVCSPPAADAAASPPTMTGSGRWELAQWLTSPAHPLTARVAVNRIWMHLMGEGIVRSVDNFGQRGERPSHPELLDALAIDLINHRWSRKQMIRQIVTTQAYRRSSLAAGDDPSRADRYRANANLDPENRLLWRAHRKRLSAESIRDTMLSVAAVLDRRRIDDPMAGYGVLVTSNDATSQAKMTYGLDDPHRSVYLPVIRSETSPWMSALDVVDADLLVGRRMTTNVPAQALALLGGAEVRDWAEHAAQRMLTELDRRPRRGPEVPVDWLYENLFHRHATTEDHALLTQWLQSEAAMKMESERDRYASWIAAMFASTEFRILE